MTYNDRNNVVKIEGILSETDINYGSFIDKRTGETKRTIGGTIKVRVDQTLPDGTSQILEIPVRLFASELTNKGTKNPSYENIERIMKEYVSIAASEYAKADAIRITTGKIQMNEYYNQNGSLVSFPRVSANFVNKIRRDQCNPEATFDVTFQVGSMGYVTDEDGVENPHKFKVGAALPQYGDIVDIVSFYATSDSVINGVNSSWQVGDTVRANGRLNFTSTTEIVKTSVDFGEPIETRRSVSISEFIITGGSATPLEGEFAYDADYIASGLRARQAHLEQEKERAKNRASATKKAPVANNIDKFANLGF